MRGESVVLDRRRHHRRRRAPSGVARSHGRGDGARAVRESNGPTVGLLNVGVEEIKGHEEVSEARTHAARAPTCRDSTIIGFVEGDDIGKGTVDVIVTEGFAGNIALKAAEGTARQMAELLRAAMSADLAVTRSAICFARGAFNACGKRWIPAKSNGGVFLGLNGIVVKSHGGISAEGFAYAIDVGYETAPLRSPAPRSTACSTATAARCEVRADRAGGCFRDRDTFGRAGLRLLHLPEQCSNSMPSARSTSDEWIVQRTGIRERHIAADGGTTSTGDRRARPALTTPG